ncbi:Variable major protein (plasmid) [Borrelia coriaceae ATCC 43381]|uniref:Variable large protein n=2 Tax=Borrelia coriaceae TaxID=144 RepID=W5SXG3_9SPIR|nr:variable large family protein [Borrelia coriaceae]AHH11849.1 Variable major protein [Borrelia coriaceae ATCC 43381]
MKINIKNIRVKSICATLFISLFLSCNSGVIEELEKKKTFADSLVKIGHGFQEIFGSFGNAFGFTAVKSTDNRSIVGDYFEKIKKGLEDTKDKLDGLATKISSTPHADTKGVEAIISSASEVFTKLIESVTKLVEVTKKGGHIGDVSTSKATVANEQDVNSVIKNIKEILEMAGKSDVKIEQREPGAAVTANADGAVAVVVKANTVSRGGGDKLAEEVSKSDPWAMINKIKNANIADQFNNAGTNEARALAIGVNSTVTSTVAKTKADLAAAVALKAMTNGQFSADTNDVETVKAAAASAVNKVLGVLDLIIRKTVKSNLEKIRKAIQGIQYSETTDQSREVGPDNK